MSLAVLMIILTLGADGQLSAAFVETDSPENCRQRAEVVRGIIGDSAPIEAILCRESAQSFDPFMHGAEEDADAPRFTFLIRDDGSRAEIARADACPAARPAPGEYCATSLQDMLAK